MTENTEEGQVHRVYTACDIENYSTLDYGRQMYVQHQLEQVQQRAAARAGVPREHAIIETAGDGDLTRWPAGTTTWDILARYVPALHMELRQLNRFLPGGQALRMRFAVAAGTSERGPYGFVGKPAVTVTRLVDAEVLRRELSNCRPHPLVVLVDDAVYEDVVAARVGPLRPEDYRRVVVRTPAKNFKHPAWISVPGRTPATMPAALRGWLSWSAICVAVVTVVVMLLSNGSPPASPHTASTGYPEIADNRRGVPTFASPAGSASPAGAIPFADHVLVSCVAPNTSGMASVNAFYRIATAPWQGLYAPANTFANGGPLGVTNAHGIDRNVPPCPEQ